MKSEHKVYSLVYLSILSNTWLSRLVRKLADYKALWTSLRYIAGKLGLLDFVFVCLPNLEVPVLDFLM